MPNTIETNLQRLVQAKSDITNAIINKGGTVGSGDGFESFANDISSIPSGSSGIETGTVEYIDISSSVTTSGTLSAYRSGDIICIYGDINFNSSYDFNLSKDKSIAQISGISIPTYTTVTQNIGLYKYYYTSSAKADWIGVVDSISCSIDTQLDLITITTTKYISAENRKYINLRTYIYLIFT